jgi:predicted nucleotidyltransferase
MMRSSVRTKTAEALLAGALEEAPPGIVSAYLFGSHAERRAHRESDVDVGVLLSYERYATQRERFEVRVRLSSLLAAALGTDAVDVVILNDAPPHLARRIVTQGRRVFFADAEGDHAFVRDVQLRAADLEPFLRRTRQVKLGAITR